MAKAQPPAVQKTPEERGLTVYHSRDGQEVRLSFAVVRRYLVSGHPEYARDEEIMLYMGMCKARGLNPFKKDCYLVKYTEGDPAATIVSIDYYRARARAQDDCRGWKCGILVKTDSIPQIEERTGSVLLEGETLIGGWFRAKPAGWDEPLEWTVALNRYVKKTRDGKPTQFWQEEKQAEMICKVAESQGLRRVWPDEFGKLYVKEEIVEGLGFDRSPIPPPREIEDNEDQKGKPGNPDPNGSGEGSTDRSLRDDKGGVGQSSRTAAKGSPKGKKEDSKEELSAADRLTMWLDMVDAGGHEEEIFTVQNEFAKHINAVPSSDQIALIKRYQEVRKNALPRWEQIKKERAANAEG